MSDRMGRSAEAAASDKADRAAYVRYAAEELARQALSGGEGAVRRFINDHEHGNGAWRDLNPWRLAEHLAIAAMRRANPKPQPPERPTTCLTP